MSTNRAHLLILTAVACLPLACKDGGCGGESGASGSDAMSATGSSSAALSAAPSGGTIASASSSANPRRAMMVRAGGAVGALFRGAAQMDLSEEQKTKLEKVATDLREAEKEVAEGDAGAGNPRKEMKEMHDVLVAGVKAGKVDAAKLDPHYAALEKDAKERATRENESLGKLHDLLEPEQRKKLVETVKKGEDERAERAKKAEAAQVAHASDAGPRPSPQRRRYERYGKDLDLDADQKKKLDAIIPNDDPKVLIAMRDDTRKRLDAGVDQFVKDTFDPKAMPPPDIKQVRKPMEEQVKFYNQLLPILKPEQREKLATRLERQGGGPGGMDHGGMRRPGRPPGMGGDHDPPEAEDDSHN